MYTFSHHCEKKKKTSPHSKPPTIQQPEVIVGQTNERAAHEQQEAEEK